MIYITGDTHGEYGRFSNRRMKKQGMELNEQDYMIICGDVGLCWAKDKTFEYNCKILSEKKYTILWVQGNHENYDMIEEFPVEQWHGGKVRHIVKDKIILLERGQVFEIDGKTFFTFGGASSHDIEGGILDREDVEYDFKRREAIQNKLPYRINHESWWKQELPTEEEMEEGRTNLAKCNYRIDYIITHCCSTKFQEVVGKITGRSICADILTDYLQEIEEKAEYSQWFFGHYHNNCNIDEKHSLLYTDIVLLKDYKHAKRLPVLGFPQYRLGDIVKIKWDNIEKVGKILVVDANGTIEQKKEPSYDILVEDENCLYKHICESDVLGKQ